MSPVVGGNGPCLACLLAQGVGNVFSPPGSSAYEQGGLTGLFSMMTHEQLVNWVLCGAAYVARVPEDTTWLAASMSVFKSAFTSLKNRRADWRSGQGGQAGRQQPTSPWRVAGGVWRGAGNERWRL